MNEKEWRARLKPLEERYPSLAGCVEDHGDLSLSGPALVELEQLAEAAGGAMKEDRDQLLVRVTDLEAELKTEQALNGKLEDKAKAMDLVEIASAVGFEGNAGDLGALLAHCRTLRESRDEVERLRSVIRTGGAAYRLERAAMGIPGGIDADGQPIATPEGSKP